MTSRLLDYLKTRVDQCINDTLTNEQEVEQLMEVLQCTMDILHEQRWDRDVEQKKNEVYRLQQRLIQAIRDHQPSTVEPEAVIVESETVAEPAIVIEPIKRRSTWGFASFGEYDSDD